MDEYRLMAGWPVEVPPYDIHCISMVSASGEVLSDREEPSAITTGALYRWIADPDLYDTTALRWVPVTSQATPVYWETGVDSAPVLITDYEYRVENERFYGNALNFDSDDQNYMHADFSATLGGAAGMTVLMVMSPNSTFGNNVQIPMNGLWCPASKAGNWTEITVQGRYLWLESESQERTRVISINPALNGNAPMYLAMVLGRPEATFYVGEGPSAIRTATVPSGAEGVPLDYDILLGRVAEDLEHNLDMALFEMNVYANRLSASQVRDEFALLSRAYGGDS